MNGALEDAKSRRFLWGALLVWSPFLLVVLPGLLNAFHGISEQKATGIGAIAGGMAGFFATFGFLVILVFQVTAIIFLLRIFSKEHLTRGFFSVISIGLQLVRAPPLGLVCVDGLGPPVTASLVFSNPLAKPPPRTLPIVTIAAHPADVRIPLPHTTSLEDEMRRIFGSLAVLLFVVLAVAQSNDQKPRVYVTESESWQTSGSSGGGYNGWGGSMSGGARPQTAEIIKTFGKRCPQVVVNDKKEKADYTVVLDHEGGKSILAHDNKVAVFNSDGDAILSHSTRELGTSVKDACEAIVKDWPAREKILAQKAQQQPAKLVSVSQTAPAAAAAGQLSVSSNPAGADIEVDGNFVGNTPSTIDVASGEHTVVVKKAGYKDWTRTLKITGGTVNLSVEFEKAQ